MPLNCVIRFMLRLVFRIVNMLRKCKMCTSRNVRTKTNTVNNEGAAILRMYRPKAAERRLHILLFDSLRKTAMMLVALAKACQPISFHFIFDAKWHRTVATGGNDISNFMDARPSSLVSVFTDEGLGGNVVELLLNCR